MIWVSSRYLTSPRQFGQARMLSSSALNAMGSSPRWLRPTGDRVSTRSGRLATDLLEHVVAHPRHPLLVACLHVEAQQRLGVARAQVEPPVRGLDGEPVGP